MRPSQKASLLMFQTRTTVVNTSGVILARLLKLPKVTKPAAAAGDGSTGGASCAGV